MIIRLGVGSGFLSASLGNPEPRWWSAQLTRFRRRQSGASKHSSTLATGRAEYASQEELADQACDLLRGLAASSSSGLTGRTLHVQLGLSHCHVGLLQLDQRSRDTHARHDELAGTWLRATSGLAAEEFVCRSQEVAGRSALLVTFVRKDVLAAVQSVAGQLKLRLASCRPAVVSAWLVNDPRRQPASNDRLVVWTEAARSESPRDARVQLVQVKDGVPSALWRGWCPAVQDRNCLELKGAWARFAASHASPSQSEPDCLHWTGTDVIAAAAGASQ